jgi:hypothetical protein
MHNKENMADKRGGQAAVKERQIIRGRSVAEWLSGRKNINRQRKKTRTNKEKQIERRRRQP